MFLTQGECLPLTCLSARAVPPNLALNHAWGVHLKNEGVILGLEARAVPQMLLKSCPGRASRQGGDENSGFRSDLLGTYFLRPTSELGDF